MFHLHGEPEKGKPARGDFWKSEEWLKAVVDGTIDGILVADARTKAFIFANARMCRITGYPLKELLKLDVTRIHQKKDLAHVTDQFKKLAQGKITIARDIPVLGKNKKVVYCDINARLTAIGGRKCLIGFFRDVTEQKNVKEKIRDSEERYKSLIELAPDGIITTNLKGTVMSCNAAFLELTGFHRKEIVGKPFTKLPTIRKRDVPKYIKVFTSIMRGKVPEPFLFEWVSKDGSIHLGETRIGFLRSGDRLVGIQAILRDVTKQKQIEEKITESETRHKMLYETSNDAIMTLEPPSWKFTSGNPTTVKMFRVKDEKQFISLGPWDVSPKHQPDGQPSSAKAEKMIKKAMKEGKNFFEWTHKRYKGDDFPATVLLSRMTIKGKSFLQATVRDVSELRKAEEKIRESEEKLRTIFNGINDVIVQIDTSGKITSVNKRIEEVFGYRCEEIIGKSFARIGAISPTDIPHLLKGLGKSLIMGTILGGGPTNTMELELRHKNGKKMPVEVSSRVLKKDGKVVGFLSAIRDVTERKEMERELKESEKKYEAIVENIPIGIYYNDFKGTFLYGNKQAEEIIGYRREELIGKNFIDMKLLGPKAMAKAIKLLALNKIGRATGPDESVLNRKDGSKRIVEISTKVITLGGKRVVMGMVLDVTKRKEMEKKDKAQSKALLEANIKTGRILADLKEKHSELEMFSKMTVGRELKMTELKDRIKKLEDKLREKGINP